MSISIDRYVSITSGVIGDGAVAQRELVGLRFTNNPRVAIGTQARVDAQGAIELFGAGSPEAVFATQYFAYVSPAPASKARYLRFAPFADTARPPRAYGAGDTYTLDEFTSIALGSLNMTLGDHTAQLTDIDLTAATSIADVASAVQAKIRAEVAGGAQWTGATVTFDAVAGAFNLVGGESGNAPIEFAASPSGTDIGWLLGWLWSEGTILSPGSVVQTPLEALVATEDVTDSFGSLSYGVAIDLAETIDVATYVAGLNVKYQFYVSVSLATYNAHFAALKALASVGLVLNVKAGEYKEALPAAIMAATNYQRRNATVNYMYRQGPYSAPYDVSSNSLADALNANRTNYYGETSSAGQKLAFFQKGYLCGGVTAPIDMNVHANEQWLKAYMQAKLLSLQLSLGKIPANDDGRGYILAAVTEGVRLGKFNGTISIGKELTIEQQIAVTELTGDTNAWRDVQTAGYWADVQIVTRVVDGITEYVAVYTLAYSKNDVVRSIEGSHNLV